MSEMMNVPDLEQMAKLRLSDEERKAMKPYLDFLTDDLKKLSAIETADIKPLIHGIELTNRFREDREVKTISRDEILKNAPQQNDGYFQVPKTLE